MHRSRSLMTLAVALCLTAALAGCGSDSKTASTTEATTATTATTAETTPDTVVEPIGHPTDPDTALVRIGDPYTAPQIVIGGDGWVYAASGEPAGFVRTPAAVPAPPAPTPFVRRQLTPEDIQIVLALAEEKGLLEPQEYEDPGVTDMPTTYVTVTDSSGSHEHVAYALGFETETGNRKDLQDFVNDIAGLDDIADLVGSDNIGPVEAYRPATFLVTFNHTYFTTGDIPAWPEGLTVEQGCVELPVEQFGEGVAGVYIADVDGTETRVAVNPDLPGDEC